MGRPPITYANVVSTLALVVAVGAGGAYAAGKIGHKQIARNAIRSKQIKNGAVASVDLQDNGVTGADVDENSLGPVPAAQTSKQADSAGDAANLGGAPPADYLSYGSTIPSGKTVTGALGYETTSGGNYREVVSFYPLRAPANVVDSAVNFTNTSVSAAAAANSDESAACTGTVSNPTAPAGQVCIYLEAENVASNSAQGFAFFPGLTQGSRLGFSVQADASGANGTTMTGTWAYTAP